MPETLTLVRLNAGSELYRCHQKIYTAIHYGREGKNRFDDPARKFGVCYLARTPAGAFAETLIRKPAGQRLQVEDLQNYRLSMVTVRQSLRLVQCHGAGLHHHGLDSSISSNTDYTGSQTFSRRCHEHAAKPDGLTYRARHDDDQLAVAIFGRARRKLTAVSRTLPWIETGDIIDEILDRYAIELM